MAEIKNRLPQRTPQALASYSFTDLASGTGYVNYKGAVTQTALTKAYILSESSFYSADAGTTLTASSPPNSTTISFDTSAFNLPRTVRGTAYLTFSRYYTTTEYKYIQSTIQKIDASGSATNISSTITATNDDVDGGHNVTSGKQMVLIQIPLTQTTIKKGEKLRLKMDLYINTGTGNIYVGHDPKGRDYNSLNPSADANISTIMDLFIPFRIEL